MVANDKPLFINHIQSSISKPISTAVSQDINSLQQHKTKHRINTAKLSLTRKTNQLTVDIIYKANHLISYSKKTKTLNYMQIINQKYNNAQKCKKYG